jgi:hypothetical protein
MADFEDESESTFWAWVVGIGLLALVLWFASLLVSDPPPEPQLRPDGTALVSPADFPGWYRDSAAANRARLDPRGYTVLAMRRLTSALAAEAARQRVDEAPAIAFLAGHLDEVAAAHDEPQAVAALALAMDSTAALADRLRPAGAAPGQPGQPGQPAALDTGRPLAEQVEAVDAFLAAMAARLETRH